MGRAPGHSLHLRSRRAAVAALLCLAGSLFAGRPASACSICRCGDPAFNALGLNIYSPNTFRLGLDWGQFDKTQGVGAGAAGGTESVLENRFTATLSFSPNEVSTFLAQVPSATRRLTSGAGSGRASVAPGESSPVTGRGLGDPELYALVRVWAAPFAPGLGRRAWIAALLGVKTPWGENDLRQGEDRLDEHAQPGTGSTDWVAGASAV